MNILKKLLGFFGDARFGSNIIVEDWRLLPRSYYKKYSESKIREMEKEKLEELRRKIDRL